MRVSSTALKRGRGVARSPTQVDMDVYLRQFCSDREHIGDSVDLEARHVLLEKLWDAPLGI